MIWHHGFPCEGYLDIKNWNSNPSKSAKMPKINVLNDFKSKIPFAKLKTGPFLDTSWTKSSFFDQNRELSTGICTEHEEQLWFTSGIFTKMTKNGHQIIIPTAIFPRVFKNSKTQFQNTNIFFRSFCSDISRRNSSVSKIMISDFQTRLFLRFPQRNPSQCNIFERITFAKHDSTVQFYMQ